MNKNTFKPIPPFRGWVLENFPFIEEDFDAITEYQLYCKIVEYIKKIANSQNEVVNNMNTLNSSFIELTNYINNYFENLDIQSEVDSKLDEMAESGQLTDIIAQYLQLAGILAYNTVDDLSNAENLNNGSFAKTYGKETYNDGYGAFYKVRQILNTDVIDGDEIVALVNYPTLIAEKIHDAVIDELINSISDIGELGNLETTEKSDLVSAINEVNSNCDSNTENIGELENLETTSKNNLVRAINEIVNKFNFSYKNNLQLNVAVESGSNPTITQSNTRLNSAYNSDGSIGKIYGNIELTGTGEINTLTYLTITSNDTGLRPSSNITLDGCAFMSIQSGTNVFYRTRVITYTLKTDGTIELTNIPLWANEVRNISFIADLIFAKDFGDSPVTPA